MLIPVNFILNFINYKKMCANYKKSVATHHSCHALKVPVEKKEKFNFFTSYTKANNHIQRCQTLRVILISTMIFNNSFQSFVSNER